MSRNVGTEAGKGSHGEAESWFVRLLEPDCPAEERAAFESWRAADPGHAAAYDEVERLWNRSEQAVKDPAVVAAAMRALRHTESEHGAFRCWFLPTAAMAAMALIAVVIVPRWIPDAGPPVGTRYATVAGEQRNLMLEDGSSVVLDTATVLVERYSDGQRRVDLQKGQAQFQVRGNPNRPFVVHVQGGTVTAIGTRFQVRVDAARTAVTLLEGKLRVATEPQHGADSRTAALIAGQRLTFNRTGAIGAVQAADLKAAQGWTEGKLFVDNWMLEDLLVEMNRYTDTQLRIGDPSLRTIPISGIFRTGDPETLTLVLQQGWPIRAKRISASEVVLIRE
ncbi:FecR domain-containing protein [Luteimonas sp. SX5]|uniref:FecR domain-containing protein n=1 Tax=Luteimonas galliterrae TaxID=2940486 RepID=A0ABT0MJ94_9GAMM|nr:FecR domain-containing protein [Luteimonas galliterrae]MCL1634942.1 FecR domain-containing protein [Luteimonas galliterrae]